MCVRADDRKVVGPAEHRTRESGGHAIRSQLDRAPVCPTLGSLRLRDGPFTSSRSHLDFNGKGGIRCKQFSKAEVALHVELPEERLCAGVHVQVITRSEA